MVFSQAVRELDGHQYVTRRIMPEIPFLGSPRLLNTLLWLSQQTVSPRATPVKIVPPSCRQRARPSNRKESYYSGAQHQRSSELYSDAKAVPTAIVSSSILNTSNPGRRCRDIGRGTGASQQLHCDCGVGRAFKDKFKTCGGGDSNHGTSCGWNEHAAVFEARTGRGRSSRLLLSYRRHRR